LSTPRGKVFKKIIIYCRCSNAARLALKLHQIDPDDAIDYFSSEDSWMPLSDLMEHYFD